MSFISWICDQSADGSVFEDFFPALETINGHIPAACNREAEALSTLWRKIPLGGSDSHTLAELGRAFTEAPGASTKQEFLDALRAGHVRARGAIARKVSSSIGWITKLL